MKSVLLNLVLAWLFVSTSLLANNPIEKYPTKDVIIAVPYVGKVFLKSCSSDLLQTLDHLSLIDKFIKDPNEELVQVLTEEKKTKPCFEVKYTGTSQ